MIKAIFFDLYGTLVGFHPSRFEIQSLACERFGLSPSPEGILKGYGIADAFMTKQNTLMPVRKMNQEEAFYFFCKYERLVLSGSDIEVDLDKAGKIWNHIKTIPYDLNIYEDVIPVLKDLRCQGVKVGLLSNMNQSGNSLIEKFGLENLVDFAVTSSEVRSEKPHPPMFMEALRQAGSTKATSVHVGDQIDSDVKGASDVGIYPVLIDRDDIHKCFNACPRIKNLPEIHDVLESL